MIRARKTGVVMAGLALMLIGCGGIGEEDAAPPVVVTAAPNAEPTAASMVQPVQPERAPASVGNGSAGAALPGDGAGAPLSSAVELVERVQPAVVTVVNEQRAGGFGAGQQVLEAGRGTGFIVDDQGHIVTNQHVVASGDRFEVIFADGQKRAATLVGADPLSDLAVVRVEGDIPASVPFGDSDALKPGQPVVAIGSPLGTFTNTVTNGIVSGLGRDLANPAGQGEPGYSNLIQHNAAINPGNSGGPLFDAAGRVIGVNTLGYPETAEGLPVQGLFFAIPSNTVRGIAEQLIEQGRVAYPALGVNPLSITEALASQYDLPVDYGVFVQRVAPDGPAARAGIREGDFILAIEGRRIDAENTYTEVLFSYRPGDAVTVTGQRGGEQFEAEVTLRERPPQ